MKRFTVIFSLYLWTDILNPHRILFFSSIIYCMERKFDIISSLSIVFKFECRDAALAKLKQRHSSNRSPKKALGMPIWRSYFLSSTFCIYYFIFCINHHINHIWYSMDRALNISRLHIDSSIHIFFALLECCNFIKF